MSDTILDGLKLAEAKWKSAIGADKLLKLHYAKEIHEYGLFSLNQLAKIVRLSPREVSAKLKANSGGGRFEPETLSTLIILRQTYLRNDPVRPSLIEVALEGGTSYSCLVRLTGIPYSTYYKYARKEEREN